MDAEEREATFRAGVQLFDAGEYLAAHELFEELWEASEAGDADFFKGLVQAAVALHHLRAGNLEGAVKLHAGQRRLLAPFLPVHRGLDLARFLEEMRGTLAGPFDGASARPRLDSPAAR